MGMNKIIDPTHHRQPLKFGYVIRNTGTGAYLCDLELRRRVFPTYTEAEMEMKRLNLSKYYYETEVFANI